MRPLKVVASLCLFFVLTACNEDNSEATDGFTQICSVFKQAQASGNTSAGQINTALDQLLENSLSEKDSAHIAWTAIRSAVASQRYALFVTAAEDTLKTDWSCPEMETLVSNL